MIDSKTKSRLISAARKISRWHPARQIVKKKQKVDKALFECSMCGKYCYEGKSGTGFITYKHKYPDKKVSQEYLAIDHIDPIINPKTGWTNWDDFLNRLFCDESNLQGICTETCHKAKTMLEREIRNKHNKKKEKNVNKNNSKKRRSIKRKLLRSK